MAIGLLGQIEMKAFAFFSKRFDQIQESLVLLAASRYLAREDAIERPKDGKIRQNCEQCPLCGEERSNKIDEEAENKKGDA